MCSKKTSNRCYLAKSIQVRIWAYLFCVHPLSYPLKKFHCKYTSWNSSSALFDFILLPHKHYSRCYLGQFFALQIFAQYSTHPASVSLPFGHSTVNNHCAFHFTLQFKLVKLYKLAFGWFSSPHKCTVLIAWWQKCSSDNPNWSTFH